MGIVWRGEASQQGSFWPAQICYGQQRTRFGDTSASHGIASTAWIQENEDEVSGWCGSGQRLQVQKDFAPQRSVGISAGE